MGLDNSLTYDEALSKACGHEHLRKSRLLALYAGSSTEFGSATFAGTRKNCFLLACFPARSMWESLEEGKC